MNILQINSSARRQGSFSTRLADHIVAVLREAGFVESRTEAQRRLYRLKPEPLMELAAWLVPFRRFWAAHVDALAKHLDRMDKAPSAAKGKKGKKKT